MSRWRSRGTDGTCSARRARTSPGSKREWSQRTAPTWIGTDPTSVANETTSSGVARSTTRRCMESRGCMPPGCPRLEATRSEAARRDWSVVEGSCVGRRLRRLALDLGETCDLVGAAGWVANKREVYPRDPAALHHRAGVRRKDHRGTDPISSRPSSARQSSQTRYSGGSSCAARSRVASVWSRFHAMVALRCTSGRNSQYVRP